MRTSGILLIGAGLLIALVGVLIWMGWLGWLGRLPGDIRLEGERTRVYIPIVSMLVVSIALSLLLSLLRRFL